jgi:8-oxo-dGTP pyrophosphatase MutT (NUDIX family)
VAIHASDRFTLPVAVFLLLVKDDKVLLARRYNTGWEDGKYGLIAGHVDGNESLVTALCREAHEEIGLTIKPQDARLVHCNHHKSNREYLYVFFEVKRWRGTPTIKELDKCDAMAWFPLHALPGNLAMGVEGPLYDYLRGVPYSETGW